MDAIISFANAVFKPLIDLGAAPMMTIFITLVSVLLGVKFSKALEGGIKLGIAIAGISAVISVLSGAFSSALTQFVESTGFQLTITDAGWAPLATITWGSPYTLYFLLVLVIVNIDIDCVEQDQHNRCRYLRCLASCFCRTCMYLFRRKSLRRNSPGRSRWRFQDHKL